MASKIIVDQIEKTGGSLTALTLPTSNASASEFLQNDGAGALSWASAAAGFNSVQVMTSSPWTKPAGITKIIVEVQGAGGSGSSGNSAGNCMGGAGGGYAKKFLDVSNTATATVVVGAGGTAVGVTNNPGVAGGYSSFTELSGSGGWAEGKGFGGAAGTTAGGTGSAGGAASGGDIEIAGGNGTYGGNMGSGGDSFMGNAGITVDSATAVSGTGYGAGGGAGRDNTSGAGADGTVVVWEYK